MLGVILIYEFIYSNIKMVNLLDTFSESKSDT